MVIDRKKLNQYMKKEIQEGRHIGLSLGAFIDGKEKFFNYGISNESPISENNFFEIASVSKIFTSILAIRLSKQGILSLDDLVEKYIPEISLKNTLRLSHLLTHTGGLDREPPSFKSIAPKNSFIKYNEDDLDKDLKSIVVDQKKFKNFSYSNYGYIILGEVIKRSLNNRNFKSILEEMVLKPLGLKDTKFDLTEQESKKLCKGHTPENEEVEPYLDLGQVYSSAGALVTTTKEMLKFCKIFVEPEELEPELKESVVDALKLGIDKAGSDISTAFHVRRFENDLFYYHPGNIAGHKCSVAFSLNTKKVIVYNTSTLRHVRIIWDLIH